MIYHIDPRTDFVTKILLGHRDHTELTEDFLNAILCRQMRDHIHSVNILNPFNEKEAGEDKLSIVDVKCQDGSGEFYQIEMQLWVNRHLPSRMLHTLSDIFQAQLNEGMEYEDLSATHGIWLLNENLFPLSVTRNHLHHFHFRDDEEGFLLSPKMSITVVELQKWQSDEITDAESRWLYFFKHGSELDDENLPTGLQDPIMEKAMQVLKTVHDKQEYFEKYQSRRAHLLEEATIRRKLERLEEAEARADRAEQELSQSEEENQRLRQLIEKLGGNPNSD